MKEEREAFFARVNTIVREAAEAEAARAKALKRHQLKQKKASNTLASQDQTLYTAKPDQKSLTKQTTLKITIPENSPAHSMGAATPQFQASPAGPKDNSTFNRGF